MLTACAGSPPPKLYALGRTVRAAKTCATSIALRTVRLPEYLDQPEIILARRDGELIMSEEARWAERLGARVRRVFQAEMRGCAQAGMVQADVRPARLTVDVEKFEADASAPHLAASWRVLDADGRQHDAGRFTLTTPSDGSERGIVRGMTDAPTAFAADLRGRLPSM